MPTYDYLCQDCGRPFDVNSSISEYAKGLSPHCPACGSARAIRTFTNIQVLTARANTPRGFAGCGPSAGPGCCG